ncbi:MAG: hypothetical protein IJ419_05855 [Agathobacter sp.]|nr:hypothetical protein [Agathobacter sp.]
MGKKRKKNKNKNKSETCNAFSRKELIDIHAEAYYKALKKIEEENKPNQPEAEKTNKSLKERIGIILSVTFTPFRVKIGDANQNDMTHGVFAFITSFAMYVIGWMLWLFAIILSGVSVFEVVQMIVEIWVLCIVLPMAVVMMMLGGMFIIAGKELERETDGAKIMLYAANILALVSVVVAVVSLFIK